MANFPSGTANEFEGNCDVAWIGEELDPPIKAVPVMDDFGGKEVWYHPKVDTVTGKKKYVLPKILARHVISTQPDRWLLLGDEKFEIRVLDAADGSYKWVTFYPWEWKLIKSEADPKAEPGNKEAIIKTYGWVEKTHVK
jgi:hypothetical protein